MTTRRPLLPLPLLLGLWLCALAPGLAAAGATLDLEWRPTTPDGGLRPGMVDLGPFAGVRIRIDRFEDRREGEPDRLGSRTDKEGTVEVTTEDDVPEFVTDRVLAALEKLGLTAVDDRRLRSWGAKLEPRDRPLVRLRGELLGLRLEEEKALEAEVRLGVVVEDAEGQPIWTGAATGRAGREARKYADADRRQTLSDALAEAIGQLVRSEPFVRALSGRREDAP
jgi:hypothetical protein